MKPFNPYFPYPVMNCIPLTIAKTLETAFAERHDGKSDDRISMSHIYKGIKLTWELTIHPTVGDGPDFRIIAREPQAIYDVLVFRGIDDVRVCVFDSSDGSDNREDGKSKVDESMIQTPIGTFTITCGDATFVQAVTE